MDTGRKDPRQHQRARHAAARPAVSRQARRRAAGIPRIRGTQMKHSVGRNIAQLRLSQGMTQERLAQRMGVTPQAVSKWENDLNYPDIAALPGLAALLGTSVDALLTVPDDGAQADGPAQASASNPDRAPYAPTETPTEPAGPNDSSNPAAEPAQTPSMPSPAAELTSTSAVLVRPEPTRGRKEQSTASAAGRKLCIEVRGPHNNVNLAFPMQAATILTSMAAAVPQVRDAIDTHGIDLDALLATAHSALEAADTSTLLDITDGEERIRFYVA